MTKQIERLRISLEVTPSTRNAPKTVSGEKMFVQGKSHKDITLKPAELGKITLDKITLVSFKGKEVKSVGYTQGYPDDSCPVNACNKPENTGAGMPTCTSDCTKFK